MMVGEVIVTARKRSWRRLCFYRCLSVHRGAVRGGRACVAHTPPPPGRHYEIRSMSLRYASYWNAFLFYNAVTSVDEQ